MWTIALPFTPRVSGNDANATSGTPSYFRTHVRQKQRVLIWPTTVISGLLVVIAVIAASVVGAATVVMRIRSKSRNHTAPNHSHHMLMVNTSATFVLLVVLLHLVENDWALSSTQCPEHNIGHCTYHNYTIV